MELISLQGQLRLVNNEPRVDSRILAESLGVQHKNLLELIRKYDLRLFGLGHLPFETESVSNSVGAANSVKFCLLNEDQSVFLLTLVRNSEEAVDLKLSLTVAFRNARALLQKRAQDPLLVALEAAAEIRKEQIELAQRQTALELEQRRLTQRLDETPISLYPDLEGQLYAALQAWGKARGGSKSDYVQTKRDFKLRYGLAKYSSLPKSRFSDALAFVQNQIAQCQIQGGLDA